MEKQSLLTPEQAEALRRHLANPPPGSAVERALAFGIDLSLTVHNAFGLTPEERLAKLDQHLAEAMHRPSVERIGPIRK